MRDKEAKTEEKGKEEYKRKIIAWRGDRGACWAVRIHFPLSYIAKNNPDYLIHITSALSKDQVGVFDLGILQRQYMKEVFNGLQAFRKFNIKLVYEIDDDLFSVPKWNPAYKVLGKKSTRENVKYFLSNVNAIFVTTERLKEVYSPYCEKIYVLPNSINPDVFYPSPNNCKRKVVLWSGSNTHKNDVALVRPALERLSKDDDVQVRLWHIDLGIKNSYLIPFCPLESFYNVLAMSNPYIGLAPLTTVPFNKSKSNLKFLEYTMQNAVTVASDFGPYADTITHEENGFLVKDNREWYDVIRYLLDNEDVHARVLANAKKLVMKEYNIEKNYMLWKNAIDELIGEK